MKKIFWGGCIVIMVFALAACTRQPGPSNINLTAEVAETGRVIDVSEKNQEMVSLIPGDVIIVRLESDAKKPEQWSLREPITGGVMSLKQHTVEPAAGVDGQERSASVWRFKILKTGVFNIRFVLENAVTIQAPIRQFKVKILSQTPLENLPDLIVDWPQSQLMVSNGSSIEGYSRTQYESVFYSLLDADQKVILDGRIDKPADTGKTDIFYFFEKKLDFKKPKTATGTILIFHEADKAQNRIQLEVKF